MRKIIIRLIAPFVQRFAKWYFGKTRRFSFLAVKGVVLPGVFYPHFTISTKLLMRFIHSMQLEGKSFLELGSGTGFISVLAAKKGAVVIALDINPKAIENTNLNAKENGVEVNTFHSDLFKGIQEQEFDYMIINPPYYPKRPENEEQMAWFCGENFEYFKTLFSTIHSYYGNESKVFMILSEDCAFDEIDAIATSNSINLIKVYEKQKWGEWNFIFQLKSV